MAGHCHRGTTAVLAWRQRSCPSMASPATGCAGQALSAIRSGAVDHLAGLSSRVEPRATDSDPHGVRPWARTVDGGDLLAFGHAHRCWQCPALPHQQGLQVVDPGISRSRGRAFPGRAPSMAMPVSEAIAATAAATRSLGSLDRPPQLPGTGGLPLSLQQHPHRGREGDRSAGRPGHVPQLLPAGLPLRPGQQVRGHENLQHDR